jgi:hypothetical protein
MSKRKKPVTKRVIRSEKIHNLHHPNYFNKIEFAFEAGGVKYYNFKKESDDRYGRFIVLQTFMQEYHLRTDLPTLQGNIKQLQKWLNPSIQADGRGQLELGRALELLSIMEQRANIAFEPDTIYRLASCIYFDEHEIITEYDVEYNQKKIESWKKNQTTDFFFHRLFRESTGLMVTSKEDLTRYLQAVPKLLKGWNTITDILSQ